jgi:hypothetical protein
MGDHDSSSVVSYTNGIRRFATLLEGLGGGMEPALGWLAEAI